MKTKYKVKGISCLEHNRGSVIYRVVTLNVPNDVNKDTFPSEQDIDFRDLLHDSSMDIILDWSVVTTKKTHKRLKVIDYINQYAGDEEVHLNLCVAYARMKDSMSGLSQIKQFEITMASLGMALDAHLKASQDVRDILTSTFDSDIELSSGNTNKLKEKL